MTFAVFEKWNAENSKQKTIFINNVEQESYSTIEKPLSWIFASSNDQGTTTVVNQNKEYYLPNTKIQVQWKIINSKKVWIQRMTCYTYSECSINFTSWKFYKAEREWVEFRWDFWNGQKYNDYNPKSLKFAPWNYKVKLTTTDNYWNQKTEIYRVEVINLYTKAEIKKINKVVDSVIDFNITEQLSKQLKIHSPEQYSWFIKYQKSLESIFNSENISSKWNESTLNNSSTEESSTKDNTSEVSNIDKQLAKDIKLRVSFQKKNLKIYWETFPDSKINIAIWEEIFTSTSDNTWKYELKINSQLVEWKYKITATAFNEHWKIIALKHSSEKEITQDYIVQLQSYIKIAWEKSNTTTKKSTTNTKTELEKKLSKNISLRVSLQKKNLKLFWTTQANSKIIFTIWEQTFTTSSGNKWEYELKTNSIQVWSYKILANVYNNWKLVAQKSSSKKTFSAEYITNMRSYLQPKTSSSKSTTSKIKKFTLENFAPKIPSFVPNTWFNLKVFVINMLIAILSLILLFIVMIKRKLI